MVVQCYLAAQDGLAAMTRRARERKQGRGTCSQCCGSADIGGGGTKRRKWKEAQDGAEKEGAVNVQAQLIIVEALSRVYIQ